MGFTVYITCANPVLATFEYLLVFLIEIPEVVAEVFISRVFHLLRQAVDSFFYSSCFFGVFIVLFQSVALESSALGKVVHRPAKDKTLCFVVEIQLFMKTNVSVGIWIFVQRLISPLPRQEVFIHRILFLDVPDMECLWRKIRTPAIFHQYLQDFNLPESAAKVLFSQCSMPGAFGCFGRLDAFFYFYTFLEYETSFFYQCAKAIVISVYNCPSKTVGSSVYS